MDNRPRRIAADMALTGGLSMVMTATPSSKATLMGWDKTGNSVDVRNGRVF
jgi:hypothetical protein